MIPIAKISALSLILLIASCGYPDHPPQWVRELVPRLECGMSPSEVTDLTEHDLVPIRAKAEFGTHRIDGRLADVWLSFEQGELVAVTSGYVDGVTSIRRTPQRNLCTGELTFIVTISWVQKLQGATVYWDGDKVRENGSSGLSFPASGGSHELRVVQEGYEPITRHLTFTPEDAGDQRIELLEVTPLTR